MEGFRVNLSPRQKGYVDKINDIQFSTLQQLLSHPLQQTELVNDQQQQEDFVSYDSNMSVNVFLASRRAIDTSTPITTSTGQVHQNNANNHSQQRIQLDSSTKHQNTHSATESAGDFDGDYVEVVAEDSKATQGVQQQQQQQQRAEKALLDDPVVSQKATTKELRNFEKMFKKPNWEDFCSKNPKEFKKYLRKGIPPELRAQGWQYLLKSKELPSVYPALYEKLLNGQGMEDELELIRRDMHRTFPEYKNFAEKDGPGQKGLFNVLQAFAFFDAKIGYVQGMAFIAGFLLQRMPEEDTFFAFLQFIHKHDVAGFYSHGLSALMMSMFQMDCLMKTHLPKVYNHLVDQYLPASIYFPPFVLSMFVGRLNPECVERIWDIFFHSGMKVIFQVMLALFKLCQKKILKCGTADILPHIYNTCKEIDPDTLIKTALKFKVKNKHLDMLKKHYNESAAKVKLEKSAPKQPKQNQHQHQHQQQHPPSPMDTSSKNSEVDTTSELFDPLSDDTSSTCCEISAILLSDNNSFSLDECTSEDSTNISSGNDDSEANIIVQYPIIQQQQQQRQIVD